MTDDLEREEAVNILLSKLQEAEERAEKEGWFDADEVESMLEKEFRHRSLEERASVNMRKLGPYQEYEWDLPIGREQW